MGTQEPTAALELPTTTLDSLSLLQHCDKELNHSRKKQNYFNKPVFL